MPRQTTIGGSSEQVGPGGNHEIRMPWVFGREKVGNNVRKRAQRPDRRVLRLRRRASEERSFCWRRSAPERWKRHHLAMEERQGVDHRWPVCREEQLAGILVLEARDLNHAVQLMSKHPGVKAGPFEIRPAEDLSEMIRESEQRRSRTKTHD